MADWVTISSLGTAGGTLVLAVATYASVRSSNRVARLTELSVLAGLRPVLTASRPGDPDEHIGFGDGHRVTVAGGGGAVEVADNRVYMAMALRNVGAGLAVLHGWQVVAGRPTADTPPPEVEDFRRQQRDLLVPAGDTGFWQGAIRDPEDPAHAELIRAVKDGDRVTVYLLYGDHEGGQRTIGRFTVGPGPAGPALTSALTRPA